MTGQPEAIDLDKKRLIADSFAGETFDPETWQVSDPGSHLSLTSAGLTMNGGNGLDGQTTFTANSALELGGTVTLELAGTVLRAGSEGILGGLYSGAATAGNCIAGFNVRQYNGNTVVAALINGAETNPPFTVTEGHQYTLRVRLHCPELLRVSQIFYGRTANDGVAQFGGGLIDAPLAIVLELRDLAASSNTTVTVLYDGMLTSSPAQAWIAAFNSVQLYGSIASVTLARTGTAWVESTDPTTGTTHTRLIRHRERGCRL